MANILIYYEVDRRSGGVVADYRDGGATRQGGQLTPRMFALDTGRGRAFRFYHDTGLDHHI